MISIFVTPFFTSKPRTGYENAVLRDFEAMKAKDNSVIVVCAKSRDVSDSVAIIRIKSNWIDSIRMLIGSPLSLWMRLKFASLCLFVESILSNNGFASVHLNQPWLFLGDPLSLNCNLTIRCHNDDIKYLNELARLEKNYIIKMAMYVESIKLKFTLKGLDSEKYRFIFYSANDLVGCKPYLGSSVVAEVEELVLNTANFLRKPTVNSKLVFFGGGNRPNLESLEWLENEFCPLNNECIELFSSDKSLCQRFKGSKWINVHGYSDNIQSNFDDPPIFIFPVFSGSGVKLKVVDALETGCYVITTDEGAAGIGRNCENLIVLTEFTPHNLTIRINQLRHRS